MIHLVPNTADQNIYLTLKESQKQYATTAESYLFMLEPMSGEANLYFIADVVVDTDRYTKIRISTNANSPTSGNLLLTKYGDFNYTVYGQTGTSNLDPEDEAVIGVWERGTLRVASSADYFNEDNETIPTWTVRR